MKSKLNMRFHSMNGSEDHKHLEEDEDEDEDEDGGGDAVEWARWAHSWSANHGPSFGLIRA